VSLNQQATELRDPPSQGTVRPQSQPKLNMGLVAMHGVRCSFIECRPNRNLHDWFEKQDSSLLKALTAWIDR